jgi:hypothetical protein
MAKTFQVEVLETGVRAVVELLEENAPRTCAALWKVLQRGYQVNAIHARWSGPEVVALVPPEAQAGVDPRDIGIENATTYPVRGDVCWMYRPPGMYRFMKEEIWDVAFIYDHECRFYIPSGMVVMNVWGRIIEGLDEFAVDCSQVCHGVRKTLRLKAITG